LQVVHQVKHALRLGMLEPGDQLPTVKEVVGQLAINANTVLKAYRDLEREGLVEGRIGVGTFVRARPPGRRLAPECLADETGSALSLSTLKGLCRSGTASSPWRSASWPVPTSGEP